MGVSLQHSMASSCIGDAQNSNVLPFVAVLAAAVESEVIRGMHLAGNPTGVALQDHCRTLPQQIGI